MYFMVKTLPLQAFLKDVESKTTLFVPHWTGTLVNDLAVPSDVVCLMGSADGIYPEISLIYGGGGGGGGGSSKMEGCSATNGCGVHVHSGTSCDTDKTQGPAQNHFCFPLLLLIASMDSVQ